MKTRKETLLENFYTNRENKVDSEYNDMLYKFNPQSIDYSNFSRSIKKSIMPKELAEIKNDSDKIKEAKKLLLEDKLNIKDIAVKLGYTSPNNFSNRFKYVTGESPTFFKLLNSKNKNSNG